jgi:DNA topoisomerase-1
MSEMKQEKWNTLKHNGPVFPPEYEYQKYKVIVQGKEHILSEAAEELAFAWAQKHATDYIKDSVFQRNFWKDFKALLPEELKKTSFPKDWDFRFIIRDIEYKKEVKKNRSKEEKKNEKEEREATKEVYGFAELNGEKVSLGNYMVEPPGLFMGRGPHPLRGSWKCRTYPEDITINHSLELNPPAPPEGHSWKEVVENKNALYVATWKQELTGEYKKILFGNDSIVKKQSDQKKFDKAVKLAQKLDYVISRIDELLDSKIVYTRKLATVAKLIAQLAIRVGDEKGEDEAETFGATTLKVEHVTIHDESIEFDFLGKDSIRYHNDVKFSPSMIRNFNWLVKDKKPSDEIFTGITSADVNSFLGEILDGVTAKVFRTAYGSKLLAEELAKEDVAGMTTAQKLKYFTDANLTVAKKLNHQTAVSPAYKEQLKRMKDKLKQYKQELKEKKSLQKEEIDEAKDMRDKRLEMAKTRYKGEKKKESIRRAKQAYEKKVDMWEKRINRLNARIQNTQAKIDIKEKTKGIAIGTSRQNYSSPRIVYSFCKNSGLDIKKIYTPTLQKKFEWAADTPEDYYLKYPNIDE